MSFIKDILHSSETLNLENRENEIFLYPYYSYVQQKISSVVPNDTIMGKSNHINSLTYQIVSYAYENYFKFVYPYEYRLAKNNNYLSGDTDKEQNRDFVVNLSSEEEWIEYLFEKYPKLLYMLETYTNGIILYLKKFLSSLQKNYQLLNSFFKLENSGVDEIQLFKGDLHNEECVSSVSFSNGVKLYYKPRCAANEKFLSDVIDLLRGMGWDVKLGIPKYIDGCSYSWHLHISPKEMTNRDSIKDYYENLGKLQGLFYLLGSQDVIPDNVFCIADCTYLIDCESILTKPYRYKDSSKLSMYLQESVIRTGILPDWMFSNANERNKISSVLFKFDDKNCHLPKVNGASVEIASDTLQYFENGFEEACNFFIAHNVEIFNFLNSYNPLRITERVLLHPTVIYTLILREMVTPPYLHGTENIKKLIEPIVREESFGSERSRIIESISDQIESGNVPFFYTMSVDPSLYTLPHKTVIKNWISKNCEAFYSIKKRLQSLNRKRENEQISIIDESVNFFLDVKDRRQKEKRILPTDGNVLDGQSIMEAIERIDKEIQNRMIDVDEELGFVCRTKNTYDGKFQICLMNDSLYDGLAGVCLFYNTLYGYSHNPKHKEIAGRIFSQLCKSREESYKGVDTESIPISPLSGITGLVYIMERFNELYDKSVYSSIVDEVKRLIPQTTQYDFMSGLAGLVLFIVQCKKIGERDRTDILMMCADRLTTLETEKGGIAYWTYNEGNDIIGRKKMVLGGFAHGSSSMSLAMFLLYKHLGDSKYYEVYRQSLLHDRSFYSEQIKGWIDGRNPEVPVDSGSWCHGAAGIALSRLILMSMGCQDPYLRKELEVAVGQIRKRIGYNLSVCHGSMGNLEVLQSIMRLKKGNGSDCIGWINTIAKSVYQGNDIICGDDNRNSQVGLFMGFAGIGYQFLRFYDWKNVPNLLCLEVTPKISLLHGE